MEDLLLEKKYLKTKNLFPTSKKVKELRFDLEQSTEERFKEIDREKSLSLEESCKKYLD